MRFIGHAAFREAGLGFWVSLPYPPCLDTLSPPWCNGGGVATDVHFALPDTPGTSPPFQCATTGYPVTPQPSACCATGCRKPQDLVAQLQDAPGELESGPSGKKKRKRIRLSLRHADGSFALSISTGNSVYSEAPWSNPSWLTGGGDRALESSIITSTDFALPASGPPRTFAPSACWGPQKAPAHYGPYI